MQTDPIGHASAIALWMAATDIDAEAKKVVRPWQTGRTGRTHRRKWTAEEDDTIRQLMQKSSAPVQWSMMAAQMNGLTGKQCRERWHNQLDPEVSKQAWSTEEDHTLIEKQVRA